MTLLFYVSSLQNKRFNRHQAERDLTIPRSTIKSAIERLEKKGLLVIGDDYNANVTTKGKMLLSAQTNNRMTHLGGATNPQGGGRRSGNLSQHHNIFSGDFVQTKITDAIFNALNPLRVSVCKMENWEKRILFFFDATAMITEKTLTITIREVYGESVEITDFLVVTRAIEYFEKFAKIGLDVRDIRCQSPHYARVEGIIAQTFKKVGDRFAVELESGARFWLDFSTGVIEDETDEKEVRSRADAWMRDMLECKAKMSDVERQAKQILAMEESVRKLQEVVILGKEDKTWSQT